jgi:hypothetical protein
MSRTAALPALHQREPEKLKQGSGYGNFHPLRSFRRNRAVRAAYARAFRMMQALGVSVTPVHLFFPVPDLNHLQPKTWPGGPGESLVDFDVEGQLARLKNWETYSPEWNFMEGDASEAFDFHIYNGFFEAVDAEVGYSILRSGKPKRVIEVGGGNTTKLLAVALRKNAAEGSPGELLTVEQKTDELPRCGIPGVSKVLQMRVQDLPPQFFDQLEAGDVLFLDSSHVVTLGSDVVYTILEILPRLHPGVLVHFHDIFMPAEYPQKFVMNNLCFWGEQYMLQAFLYGNRSYKILWSSSMMQLAHPGILRKIFPQWLGSFLRLPDHLKTFVPTFDGENVWPCSLWLEKQA